MAEDDNETVEVGIVPRARSQIVDIHECGGMLCLVFNYFHYDRPTFISPEGCLNFFILLWQVLTPH